MNGSQIRMCHHKSRDRLSNRGDCQVVNGGTILGDSSDDIMSSLA